MASTRFVLAPDAPFDFEGTAYSHGWVVLAPNAWDESTRTMHRVHRLATGRVVRLALGAGEGSRSGVAVGVEHRGRLPAADRRALEADVRHMFRLDEDLRPFYALCRGRGRPWNRVCGGLGRLLRSPTLFEDAVKTLCTTNVQWGGTKRMVRGLVDAFGAPWPADPSRRAFPTAEALAEVSPDRFAARTSLGYRAAYVHELARRVASGDIDLDALARSRLPTAELRAELLAIRGVGPYAAATLLMLLGRYDELAVDSVFREFVTEKYFGGERPSEAEARAVYEGWGEWKYLAYWFDLWEGVTEGL
jgi:3-methyladenine DNA glycosylase/8-oxoguanine DNA glycosylase